MEELPTHWPPREPRPDDRRVYPLFVLPQVLVPRGLLQLHVFEPRYVQMVEDVLDGPGRIVIGSALQDFDLPSSPPFCRIAGLGEIGRHDRLPDGRYLIVLVGLRRVLAEEVESDRLYRKVRTEPAREVPVPREREEGLRDQLVRAIQERTEEGEAPVQAVTDSDEGQEEVSLQRIPTSSLADLLLLRMPLSRRTRTDLYAELDTEKRAREALAHHAVLPRKPPGADA